MKLLEACSELALGLLGRGFWFDTILWLSVGDLFLVRLWCPFCLYLRGPSNDMCSSLGHDSGQYPSCVPLLTSQCRHTIWINLVADAFDLLAS